MEKLNILFLKINPDWGNNTLKNLMPILTFITIMSILIVSIDCLLKRQWIDILKVIFIGGFILVLMRSPELFYSFGEFLMSIFNNMGDDLIVK